MKLMFVEARKKQDLNIDGLNFNILPKNIFLVYSVQYSFLAQKVKKKLEKIGKKVNGFRQVLGCSMLKNKCPILLIGSGHFHAIQLALQGNTVYILENKIIKLDEKEIKMIKNKRKAALSKFLASNKIGILVSTKPGQENLKKALILKKKLEKQDKECFVFIADNINNEELENYDIGIWLNTSCPALTLDSKVIHLHELNL